MYLVSVTKNGKNTVISPFLLINVATLGQLLVFSFVLRQGLSETLGVLELYVEQAALTEICLPNPETKGLHYHTWLHVAF